VAASAILKNYKIKFNLKMNPIVAKKIHAYVFLRVQTSNHESSLPSHMSELKHRSSITLEHAITIKASLLVALQPTVITYHCRVISLESRNLVEAIHLVVMTHINAGSTHQLAAIFHVG
jgi:hypothetical protein